MKLYHLTGPAPLFTNCFLVISDAGHAVAIDPQAGAKQFLDKLKEEGAVLQYIFLTHGHWDHTGSLKPLREATGAKVMAAAEDAAQFHLDVDEFFVDGSTVALDELEFRVIRTPGHTPGSTCLLCGDLLFSGDTLFAQEVGRCDLEGGSWEAMQASLQKLCRVISGDPKVLPGHGEFSTFETERRLNPYLKPYV